MSLARKIKRDALLSEMKANGMRRVCKKCKRKNSMKFKPGYGQVCIECGWWPPGQIRAMGELNNESR